VDDSEEFDSVEAFMDYLRDNGTIDDVADSKTPIYNADLAEWFGGNWSAVDEYFSEFGTIEDEGIMRTIAASYCWSYGRDLESAIKDVLEQVEFEEEEEGDIDYYGSKDNYIHLKFGRMLKAYNFTDDFIRDNKYFTDEYLKYWKGEDGAFKTAFNVLDYVENNNIDIHFYFNMIDTPADSLEQVREYLVRENGAEAGQVLTK